MPAAVNLALEPSTEPKENQERALLTAGEVFQHMVMIRANLPKELASLIEAGETEKAVSAMLAWGKGKKPIETIWREVTTNKTVTAATATTKGR